MNGIKSDDAEKLTGVLLPESGFGDLNTADVACRFRVGNPEVARRGEEIIRRYPTTLDILAR